MIRVTVEIVPHGIEERKKTIGRINIVNTCKHKKRPVYGEYKVCVVDVGDATEDSFKIPTFKRSDGIWKLLFKIFKKYLNKS